MKKVIELADQVTTLLLARKTALTFAEIAAALELRGNVKKKLEKSLHDLVRSGQIVKIRDQRYTVGSAADLVTGTLTVLRSGHGIVNSPEQNVFVPEQDLDTALPGDRVVVRLDAEGRTDRPGLLNGKVIRILERARHEIVGTLRSTGRFFYVVPMDPSYGRDIYVPDVGDAKLNDRVLCRFTAWQNRHVNPEGVIIETLGPADDPTVDTLAIIKHYQLPDAFPEDVVREAESVSALMDQPGERLDCRALVTFTIDPVRARDFDDALSLESKGNGEVELGVHIADVCHFVRPDSRLDQEAALRGNSVYLPDMVLPMLPEQLSNGICSLRPNEDRLAFSVFMTINAAGHVTHSRFAKAIIRSQARLTYEQAMAVISGKAEADFPLAVTERIVALHTLAQTLRQNRFARFALDLDMPECEIVMGEGGRIREIRVVANDPSHQLVEECMVAANEAVARELTERGLPLISRLHAPPKPEKIEDLRIQLQGMGLEPGDLTKPRNMSRFLQLVQNEPLVMHIRMAVLRSLNRALYSAVEGGHYGLAKTYYAHFTSPIRRYPDLIVHRQLEALVEGRRATGAGGAQVVPAGRRAPYTKDELVPIAANCSLTEQTADEAERALEEIKKYRFLDQQIKDGNPLTYEAVVVAALNFGVFVEVIGLQMQGLVHVSALSKEFVTFDRMNGGMLKAGKVIYRVGTRLKVQASRVDFDKRKIDFVPVGGEGRTREERGPVKARHPTEYRPAAKPAQAAKERTESGRPDGGRSRRGGGGRRRRR
ncbi:MAG: ribonuclease R [Lentisphaerae bacterium]|nr:ribonuclease R [Lentisphaerota bacterium]